MVAPPGSAAFRMRGGFRSNQHQAAASVPALTCRGGRPPTIGNDNDLEDAMTAWTFADVWEAIAAAQPERPAVVQDGRVVSWGEFDARSDALAAHLIARGLGRQAKVAAYLYNGPEYLEA